MNKYSFHQLADIDQFEISLRNSQSHYFYSKSWLRYLEKISGGEFIGIEIHDEFGNKGYFGAFYITKMGIKIIASPFRGWSTPYMGVVGAIPICGPLMEDLIEYLKDHYPVQYIEIINANEMAHIDSGKNFETSYVETLVVDLDKPINDLWLSLKTDCRNYLSQFERKGGRIVIAEADEQFARHYYAHITEVFSRQGMAPTYSLDHVKNVLAALRSGQGQYLCLHAYAPNDEIIASAIFFGSDEIFYFWGGASKTDTQHYRPNESIIWFAMQHFQKNGYKKFDLIGVRQYKLKFSPQTECYTRYTYSRLYILIKLKNLAERLYFLLLRIKSFLRFDKSKSKKMDIISENIGLKSGPCRGVVQYIDKTLKISSYINKVRFEGRVNGEVLLPLSPIKACLSKIDIFRRFYRTHKMQVHPSATGSIIFWKAGIYHLNHDMRLKKILSVSESKNLMFNAFAKIDDSTFIFGEYGEPNIQGKNIYKTSDGGLSWRKVLNLPNSKVDHIHSCKWDAVSNRVWIFTGDRDGKCWIISCCPQLLDIKYYGDGSQSFRTTSAFFTEKYIYWVTDTPNVDAKLVRLNRQDETVIISQDFPAPVYYYGECSDGVFLISTAVEPGEAIKTKYVNIYASRNLKKWTCIGTLEADNYHRNLFGFSTISFPSGDYASNNFYINCDSVLKYDGAF